MNPEEIAFLSNLEAKLWQSANKLLPSLDAARYKHVMLGLIFIKYVSDAFEVRVTELKEKFADPKDDYFLGDDAEASFIAEELENRDYYAEKNVFWVPECARWKNIEANCRLPVGANLPWGGEFRGVGRLIDDAMTEIEKENPKLKNILFKDFAREGIDDDKYGSLISDVVGTIPFVHKSLNSKDILGHVYEYFLGEFASAEGKKGGQFYTPKSIVSLIVEILKPFKGRVYDPAMGSGGFFVQSDKFIDAHGDRRDLISVYGQESNQTTWRLAAMNMAIRGIDFNFGGEPANTFTRDLHPDLRADFVMANPPVQSGRVVGRIPRLRPSLAGLPRAAEAQCKLRLASPHARAPGGIGFPRPPPRKRLYEFRLGWRERDPREAPRERPCRMHGLPSRPALHEHSNSRLRLVPHQEQKSPHG